MKKTLLTLALVAATSVAAFAQGKITFANDATRLFTMASTLSADAAFQGLGVPTSASGGLPSGNVITAILYGGSTASSLTLQTAVNLTGTDMVVAGRLANKASTLIGMSGGVSGFFQVVLQNSTATRLGSIAGGINIGGWADLVSNPVYFGTTGMFTATPNVSTYQLIYNAASPVFSTWTAGAVPINVVPEPSTFALAGLGAAAMLIFRRRK